MKKLLSLTELFEYYAGKELKEENKNASFASSHFPLDDCDKRYTFDFLSLAYIIIAEMKKQNNVSKLQYAVENDMIEEGRR
jgi:hypothetical protein